MITRFESVTLHQNKSCKCGVCNKSLRRSKKFEQTLNPFNKNADGKVKTEAEIRGELLDEARAWAQAPEYCKDHTSEFWPAMRQNETEPVWYQGRLYKIGEFREANK